MAGPVANQRLVPLFPGARPSSLCSKATPCLLAQKWGRFPESNVLTLVNDALTYVKRSLTKTPGAKKTSPAEAT